MLLTSVVLPLAGTIALATAAPARIEPLDASPVLEDRSPAPDIGAFLDKLPALIDDIVSTSISIVTALKEAVRDDALVRNDLEAVLGRAPPPPANTTLPGDAGGNTNGNEIAARQDQGQGGNQGAQPPANGTAACPDVAVLFARGAKEPGNVGFLAGPPLFAALETYVNGTSAIAVQGIRYRSSDSSSSERGPALMADLARRTAAACPNTRIAMAGYSIGAVVVRSALEQLGAANANAVNSVVLFGDPREGQPVPVVDAGRVATFCHDGDVICRRSLERQNGSGQGGSSNSTQGAGDELVGEQEDMTGTDGTAGRSMLGAHLDYGIDAPAAAMFVMQRSGLGVASADAMNQGMQGTLAGMVQDIARNGVDRIAT